jgi:hypothetical protein
MWGNSFSYLSISMYQTTDGESGGEGGGTFGENGVLAY